MTMVVITDKDNVNGSVDGHCDITNCNKKCHNVSNSHLLLSAPPAPSHRTGSHRPTSTTWHFSGASPPLRRASPGAAAPPEVVSEPRSGGDVIDRVWGWGGVCWWEREGWVGGGEESEKEGKRGWKGGGE